MYYHVKATQTSTSDNGTLQVVTTAQADNHPIPNATIDISYKGAPNDVLEQVTTNEVGRTEPVFLPTPPIDYSLDPSNIQQPYSQYDLQVTAEGYEPVIVSGSEILPDTQSVQPIHMRRTENYSQGSDIVIPDHTLYGNYPPKIAEAEIKPIEDSGEIVLSRVVVPETIIVHDGAPTDSTASDYYVPYREYIKNVASSEIYATWPQSTITANILAIMSFTLNRVYTEWYRNKGYNYTITSSTAFDHKYIHGRNLFDNISLIVDEIFDQYLSRPNVKQPILTQYCDGKKVFCPNWMTK